MSGTSFYVKYITLFILDLKNFHIRKKRFSLLCEKVTSATRQTTIRKLATALRSRQAREAHGAHFGEPKPCTWAPDDDELAAACALRLGAVLDELPPSGTALNDLCCLLV